MSDMLNEGLSRWINGGLFASQQAVMKAEIFGKGQDGDMLIGRIAYILTLVDGFGGKTDITAAGQRL